MKKLFLLFGVVGMIFTACNKGDFGNDGGAILDPNNPLNNHKCASNEILYISKSCTTMELGNSNGWGANLVSNTYDNGVGRLKFDAKVTTIPVEAFARDFGYNEMLMYIKMPNTITSIGREAFCNCTSLTSVTIPSSVTSIVSDAFYHCTSLNAFYGKFASSDNRCLIVDGVLSSFAPAGLTEYTIPDSVTSIGNDVFYRCTSLTSVTIPNSVTSIGNWAFDHCTSLTSVTIPDSVTSIGRSAFEYCTSLTSVYCKPTTPPTANVEDYDWYAFDDNAWGRKIYVPRSSVEAYKNAEYWSSYKSYIEGYDF